MKFDFEDLYGYPRLLRARHRALSLTKDINDRIVSFIVAEFKKCERGEGTLGSRHEYINGIESDKEDAVDEAIAALLENLARVIVRYHSTLTDRSWESDAAGKCLGELIARMPIAGAAEKIVSRYKRPRSK